MKMMAIGVALVAGAVIASAYLLNVDKTDTYAIMVETDKDLYTLNDSITVRIIVTEFEQKAIAFPTSQMADFCIYENGNKIYQWSDDRAFAQVFTHINLSKGLILFEGEVPTYTLGTGTFELRTWMEGFYEDDEYHNAVHAEPITIKIA